MSTRKLPEKHIFRAGAALGKRTQTHAENPESRVNPRAPRAASKQHYAVSEIHLIDSHTYRVKPGSSDARPCIATARG
ncbi:hypothetical protein B0G74_0242 [Paraburkholderia sp. BL9I2N2]|nr:hypothetical protein B0G74_0242 [Paraburkholderia sp. BL9I2N2]